MKSTKMLLLSATFVTCLNIECNGESMNNSQADSTKAVSIGLETQKKYFNGFYVGMFGGLTKRNVDFKMTPLSQEAKALFRSYESDYSDNGFLFGGLTGYGRAITDNAYIGAEVTLHLDTANKGKNHSLALNNELGTLNFKTTYHRRSPVIGIGIRLGTIVDKRTLIYVKPALELSKDKLELESSVQWSTLAQQVANQQGIALPSSSSKESISAWKLKFSPAMGAEYAFTHNLLGRLEYSYSFGLNGRAAFKDKDADAYSEAKCAAHSIKVGISYLF